MDWITVDSSMIEAIAYDKDDFSLGIRFASNGSEYRYHNVPEYVFNNLKNASSVGKFFISEIKERFHHNKM